MSFPKRNLDRCYWLEGKESKAVSTVWLEIYDRLITHLAVSSIYYPNKFVPGEWYDRYVKLEEKELLQTLNSKNMTLPFPHWKFFGTCKWDNPDKNKPGMLVCGSCRADIKGNRTCLQDCDPQRAILCPFHCDFSPNNICRPQTLVVPHE